MHIVNRYLNLLEVSVAGMIYRDPSKDDWNGQIYDENVRALGRDWPSNAHTMVGTVRLRSLRHMCETVLSEEIPGDFIETGVWRGGACIYMKGILAAHGDSKRRVFVADSFKGLPPPDTTNYPIDEGACLHNYPVLAVSIDVVEDNFRRYGLLDERVVFLEGWFKDTLPGPVERLAILRLDGDMYESTTQALEALYSKVSPGGYVIIDDYTLGTCAQAVSDYREKLKITSPVLPIDGSAVFWRVPS